MLSLKLWGRGADPSGMGKHDELTCPTCEADIPLGGDEALGDEVYCAFCGAPSIIIAKGSDEDWDLEEDF